MAVPLRRGRVAPAQPDRRVSGADTRGSAVCPRIGGTAATLAGARAAAPAPVFASSKVVGSRTLWLSIVAETSYLLHDKNGLLLTLKKIMKLCGPVLI